MWGVPPWVACDHTERELPRGGVACGVGGWRCVGGREVAAICGVIISARLSRVRIVVDGYVTCGAAAVLDAMDGHALGVCVVAHVSAEPGHRRLLEKLGKVPLFDFGLRLGEGSRAEEHTS